MSEKQCFKCGKVKSLDEFYTHPEMSDGHLNKCKDCTRKDARETRDANLDYYLDYDRRRNRTPEREATRNASLKRQREKDPDDFDRRASLAKKKYIKNNPEKRHAHMVVSNAIRDGKIIKLPCEECGRKDSEAHHEDYSKPLMIKWLCRKHHGEIHRMQIN